MAITLKFWIRAFCAIATILGCSLAADVTIDFGTTLSTNDVSRFHRKTYVVGHGFTSVTKNSPKELMEKVVEDYGVQFGRHTGEGPFTGADNFQRDQLSAAQIQADGEEKIKRGSCGRCDELKAKHMTADRIGVDTLPGFHRALQSGSISAKAKSFAGTFFQKFFHEHSGYPAPKYYECVNEPMVHWKELRLNARETETSVNRRISKGCHDLCVAVKAKNPGMLVGGFGNAFVRPYYDNFQLFNRRMRIFLDAALDGNCIGFVSEHLYDTGISITEGNMDILETYQYRKARKVLPYLVTELSSTKRPWFDQYTRSAARPLEARDFKIMTEAYKILMALMRYPDTVKKAVTFLSMDPGDGRMFANHRYPWSLLEPTGKDSFKFTPLIKFFEILRGIDGDFTYSYSDDPNVVVNTVSSRDKAYIMLQNVAEHSVNANIRFPHGNKAIKRGGVEIRRMWLVERAMSNEERNQELKRGGSLGYDEDKRSDVPSRMSLRPEEMVVIEVQFDELVAEYRTVERTRKYSVSTTNERGTAINWPYKIEKDKKINFHFQEMPRASGSMAYIRISHSRTFIRTDKPKVYVNDVLIGDYDARMAGPKNDKIFMWFGVTTVAVPLEMLTRSSRPKVSVEYEDQGGFVGSVVIIIDQCRGDETCCLLGGRDIVGSPMTCPRSDRRGAARIDVNEKPDILANPSFEMPGAIKSGSTRENAVALPESARPDRPYEWVIYGDAEIREGGAYWGDRRVFLGRELAQARQLLFLPKGPLYRFKCYTQDDVTMEIVKGTRVIRRAGSSTQVKLPTSDWVYEYIDFRVDASDYYEVILRSPELKTGSADVCTVEIMSGEAEDTSPPALPPTNPSDDPPSAPEPEPTPKPAPPAPSAPAKPEGTDGEQILIDPSFNGLDDGWTLRGSAELQSDWYFDGPSSVWLKENGSAKVEQIHALKGGKRFHLRCHVLGSGPVKIQIRRWSNGDVLFENKDDPPVPIPGSDWGIKDLYFTTREEIFYKISISTWSGRRGSVDLCTLYPV